MRPVAGEEGEELQVQCRLAAARARRPLGSCLAGLSLGLVRGALGCPVHPGPHSDARVHATVLEIMEGVSQYTSLPLCLQYGDLPLNYIFILSAILAAYMICKRLRENGGGSP